MDTQSSSSNAAAIGAKLKQIYPQYAQVPDEQLGMRYIQKYGNNEAAMGALGVSASDPVTELANLKAQKELEALKRGDAVPANLTEGQKLNQNLATSGLTSLNSVRDFYEKDPGILTKQKIPGKFQSRSFDAALFAAVDALLRIRTGATAPEDEIRRYMSAYGPQFGDSPEDVDFKLNQLKNALTLEGGVPEEKVKKLVPDKPVAAQEASEEPKVKQSSMIPQGDLPIISAAQAATDFLFPKTKEFAGNILEQRKNLSPEEAIAKASEYQENANPVNFTRNLIQGQDTAGEMAGPLSEAVLAIGGGKLIQGAMGLAKPGGGGVVKDIVTKGPFGAVKGYLGDKRTEAALQAAKDGVTISGKEAVQAANKYLKNMPLAEGVADKILPTLNKAKMGVDEALERLDDIGKIAYTKTGDPKSTAQAQLFNKIYGNLRKQIQEKAPAVAKQQSRLAKTHDVEKVAKKLFSPFGVGIGLAGAAGAALQKELFNN